MRTQLSLTPSLSPILTNTHTHTAVTLSGLLLLAVISEMLQSLLADCFCPTLLKVNVKCEANAENSYCPHEA